MRHNSAYQELHSTEVRNDDDIVPYMRTRCSCCYPSFVYKSYLDLEDEYVIHILSNSIGPNLARGDRNTNSSDNIGLDGTSDNGICSSILTQHGSSNSNLHYHSSKSSSSSIFTQHGYQLTVNLPPPPFGASTMSISIATANGYADQANVASADVTSWTFNIPPNQGNWIRVCANSENFSGANCNTYNTTGKDMSVSVSPVLDNGNANYMYPGNNGIDGFSSHHGIR
jgi:hypothetical protein